MDPQRLAEELAELQSNKGRALPALLSPPMVGLSNRSRRVSFEGGRKLETRSSGGSSSSNMLLEVDDDYAKEWSEQLNQSWLQAHERRNKEIMRRMVYRLHPEVWTRLRPPRPSLSNPHAN